MDSLLFGLGLGLAAGFSPGPLRALVLGATLERGFAAGARVAAAPLLTDLPIIVVSIFLLSRLPETFLGGLGWVGGSFVVLLGISTLRRAWQPQVVVVTGSTKSSGDLWRGALVNVLSPHPWIFWLSVGAPQVVGLWRDSPPRGVAFLGAFYISLVGTKVAVAALVAGGRRRLLQGSGYRRVLIVCGVLLVVLGGLLILDGSHRLAVIG